MANPELQRIVDSLHKILEGEPWYGRPVYALLDDIDPSITEIKPEDEVHSLVDLIYHMDNWAGFVLDRLEGNDEIDPKVYEESDWRQIDPAIHNWNNGVEIFKNTHNRIISILGRKSDSYLNQPVPFRNYDFRFLLDGLIQHNIYHSGQIALLNKILTGKHRG